MVLSLFLAGGRGDAALTVLSRIPGRWCSHCFGQDTREMVLSLFLSRIPRDAALTVSGLDLERCCSHCT